MTSVRLVRDENGGMKAEISDNLQRVIDAAGALRDNIPADLQRTLHGFDKVQSELAASLPTLLINDLAPFRAAQQSSFSGRQDGATSTNQNPVQKRARELEIEADFSTFVADPAKLQFPSCEIEPELRTALLVDLADGGGQFEWITGENPWEALSDAVSARAGLTPAEFDRIFPEVQEKFETYGGGFTSIIPRHEWRRKRFAMIVRFVRNGRLLAFGERHGKPVFLEGSQFEDNQFHIPGVSGPSWSERIRVFAPLRFIGAKDARETFLASRSAPTNGGPRDLATRQAETRAALALKSLHESNPIARFAKDNAVSAMMNLLGLSKRGAKRAWERAGIEAWTNGGRIPVDSVTFCSDDLAKYLESQSD